MALLIIPEFPLPDSLYCVMMMAHLRTNPPSTTTLSFPLVSFSFLLKWKFIVFCAFVQTRCSSGELFLQLPQLSSTIAEASRYDAAYLIYLRKKTETRFKFSFPAFIETHASPTESIVSFYFPHLIKQRHQILPFFIVKTKLTLRVFFLLVLCCTRWWLMPCWLKFNSQRTMFHFHSPKNFSVLLTTILLLFFSTQTESNNNTCESKCGIHSLQYPFGFSDGCPIRLNCTLSNNNNEIQISSSFKVQNVTSSSIFINLPAKCNRTFESIKPLFAANFAPTTNNSLLLQNCTSANGGCVIPTSTFLSNRNELDGCDERSDNISCFTTTTEDSDLLKFEDLNKTGCKFLFSSIAIEQRNETEQEVSLQFQVLELGWWLEGSCQLCSSIANCTEVHLPDRKLGFRCHCPEGYDGDGFVNGTGCRRSGEWWFKKFCILFYFLKNSCSRIFNIGDCFIDWWLDGGLFKEK